MGYQLGFRLVLAVSASLLLLGTALGQDRAAEHRVYEYVIESAAGSIDNVEADLRDAATAAGWETLAAFDAGVPDGCSYRARVMVLFNPEYGRQLMEINRVTGPFAVVDRVNLFEDENGLHVAVVNPLSIDRTVLMDADLHASLAASRLADLRSLIAGAVGGTPSTKAYGQGRKRGYIGKTMGVMAGGKFSDKIQEKIVIPNATVSDVAEKVRLGLEETGSRWDLHLAYELPLPAYDVVIFGSTGSEMERKSFSIVNAGSDKDRKDFACPGLAHAAAYPLEVVVTKNGDTVEVQILDAMYRMKMYFEDAGKIAFMKNMGMPGSLADELRDQIRSRFPENAQ